MKNFVLKNKLILKQNLIQKIDAAAEALQEKKIFCIKPRVFIRCTKFFSVKRTIFFTETGSFCNEDYSHAGLNEEKVSKNIAVEYTAA